MYLGRPRDASSGGHLNLNPITHMAPGARPTSTRKRATLTASLLILAVAVVGCGDLLPDPPGNGEPFRQSLRTTASVSAVTATIAFDPHEAAFRGVTSATNGVVAAAEVDTQGGQVKVSVFRQQPVIGTMLTLHWDLVQGSEAPTVFNASAWRADATSASGAVSLGELVADQSTAVDLSVSDLAAFDDEAAAASCPEADYPTGIAARPLGDLDGSGGVDLRDVVLAHNAITTGSVGSGGPNSLYHTDLTGDCSYTEADVAALLMKAAHTGLPARPVMKPQRLTYLDLVAGTAVLVGNAGNEPLELQDFVAVNLNGSVIEEQLVWTIEGQSAVWTLSGDPNDALGTLSIAAADGTADVAVGNISVLVAGQSNAVGWDTDIPTDLQQPSPGVMMLANSYSWQPAIEPLDDPAGQRDSISLDSTVGTSAGTALGRSLRDGNDSAAVAATGRDTYLIPAALGGSRMTPRSGPVGWYLGSDDLAGTSRATLFGSAAYRALVSAGAAPNPAGGVDPQGGPVSAVFWYQGESDNSDSTLRQNYSGYTKLVFDALLGHISSTTAAVQPVVIYAQLAPYGCCANSETPTQARTEDLRSHDIAERQRRFEQGALRTTPQLQPNAGLSGGIANAYMVVTHDLPRSDRIHLSSEAQVILAGRVALAYQEHVLGWDVDGTGPRITAISRSGDTIVLTVDRDVEQTAAPGPNGFSGYFTVYLGAPSGGSNYTGYGGNELDILSVRRDPENPRRILIDLDPDRPAGTTFYLRYKRPHEASEQSDYVEDVIRGVDSGLPLPSFGPLRVP